MPSLAPYNGSLDQRLAAHFLRRTTFGSTKAEIDSLVGLTPQQALDLVFTMPPLPDHPKDPATGQTWVVSGRTGANSPNQDLKYIVNRWFLDLAFRPGNSPNLFIKLVFFLHTCFPTGHNDITYSENFYWTLRLFMLAAQGNLSFKELALKICLDNGMNNYLDIGDSEVGNPNENFAREFFELHTVGKGATIGVGDYTTFTEQDVLEAARLLTGYRQSDDWDDPTRQDPDTGLPRCWFDISRHDTTDKLFSHAFNYSVISGRSTVNGMLEELGEFVDMIFASNQAAEHLARRMYRFFVRFQISQEVEDDIITPLAQHLLSQNYDLTSAIRLLLGSQHFFDQDDADSQDEVVGALIKAPMELQGGILRFFGVPMPDPAADLFHAYITVYGDLDTALAKACFDLFEPVEVAGYHPVYQPPEYNRLWISAKSISPRYQMAEEIISGPPHLTVDLVAWISDPNNIPDFAGADPVGNPGPHAGGRIATHLVATLLSYLLPEPVPQDRQEYFEQLLLDTLSPINWMFEWDFYLNNNDPTNIKPQIEKLIRGILQSPEYQLG